MWSILASHLSQTIGSKWSQMKTVYWTFGILLIVTNSEKWTYLRLLQRELTKNLELKMTSRTKTMMSSLEFWGSLTMLEGTALSGNLQK